MHNKNIHLYLDESGSRDPSLVEKDDDPKWFGFGGVMVMEEDRIKSPYKMKEMTIIILSWIWRIQKV